MKKVLFLLMVTTVLSSCAALRFGGQHHYDWESSYVKAAADSIRPRVNQWEISALENEISSWFSAIGYLDSLPNVHDRITLIGMVHGKPLDLDNGSIDLLAKGCQCKMIDVMKNFDAVGVEEATMRVKRLDSLAILNDQLWQGSVMSGGVPLDTLETKRIITASVARMVRDSSVFTYVMAYSGDLKPVIFGTEPMRIWTEEQIILLTYPMDNLPLVTPTFGKARSEVALGVVVRYALEHPGQKVALVYGRDHLVDWTDIYREFGLVPKILDVPECHD